MLGLEVLDGFRVVILLSEHGRDSFVGWRVTKIKNVALIHLRK
jgi:hypothetical protein